MACVSRDQTMKACRSNEVMLEDAIPAMDFTVMLEGAMPSMNLGKLQELAVTKSMVMDVMLRLHFPRYYPRELSKPLRLCVSDSIGTVARAKSYLTLA